jgi:hydroxymethylbilane synthase
MNLGLPLRLGTRGSPLALAQAGEIERRLMAAHPALREPGAILRVMIRTSGDRFLDRPLAELGGKGLFTREIEEALLARQIDLAVHSMKDMPTVLPDGLAIVCVPPREDPRDVLIANGARGIAGLAAGARVGTASLRRQAQLLARRPDLRIEMLRGNVETRVRKVRDGAVDATLLALAGLRRLGAARHADGVLEPDEMLPAVGQGALAIEARADDGALRALLAPLDDAGAAVCTAAERALLAVLDGSCRTPIAALAELQGSELYFRALIATPDGRACHRAERRAAPEDAVALGREVGAALKAEAGPGFFGAA